MVRFPRPRANGCFRECLNAPPPRAAGAFKRVRCRAWLVLVHGLAVRAERVALVEPLAGGADGVAAACGGGELDHPGALLARAGVDLAAARGRCWAAGGRDWRGHVG